MLKSFDSNFNNSGGIYKIENLVNGKVYIGSTGKFTKRFTKHKIELEKRVHNNKHLVAAYHLYGFENFSFSILERVKILTKTNLEKTEQFYIDKYDASNRLKGYNKNPLASRATHTEEAKRLMSRKVRQAYDSGRLVVWNKGKACSEEYREAIKEGAKHRRKKIWEFDYFTKEFTNEYESLADCCNINGLDKRHIGKSCNRQNEYKYNDKFYVYYDKLTPEEIATKKVANKQYGEKFGKTVYVYDLEYNYVGKYPSVRHGCDAVGLDYEKCKGSICTHIKRGKGHSYRYRWSDVELDKVAA